MFASQVLVEWARQVVIYWCKVRAIWRVCESSQPISSILARVRDAVWGLALLCKRRRNRRRKEIKIADVVAYLEDSKSWSLEDFSEDSTEESSVLSLTSSEDSSEESTEDSSESEE